MNTMSVYYAGLRAPAPAEGGPAWLAATATYGSTVASLAVLGHRPGRALVHPWPHDAHDACTVTEVRGVAHSGAGGGKTSLAGQYACKCVLGHVHWCVFGGECVRDAPHVHTYIVPGLLHPLLHWRWQQPLTARPPQCPVREVSAPLTGCKYNSMATTRSHVAMRTTPLHST